MNKRIWIIGIIIVALFVSTGCTGARLITRYLSPPVTTHAETANPTPEATSVAPVSSSSPATAQLGSLDALQEQLSAIYQTVNPSVVSIQIVKKESAPSNPLELMPIPGFPFQMPQQQPPQQQYEHASGSGFVWDKEGHIVTNNHVVEGADTITVRFADGTTVPAKLVGADPDSDLAVVKVDMPAARLQPVQLADPDSVHVGQFAIAIGSPFGLENSMTVGFVSALGRSLPVHSTANNGPSYTIPEIIQTDAPINPGNSGGVLVNDKGEVIGVTTAIISPIRASAGIGFAVPVKVVQEVIPDLIKSGHHAHAWLGISGTTLTPDMAKAMKLDETQRGALVIDVLPGGPADKAGLHGSDRQLTVADQKFRVGGDVITAIDDQQVRSFEDVVTYIAHARVGQKITLTILRDGRTRSVDVTLGERPTQQSQGQGNEAQAAQGAWLGISGMSVNPDIAEAMGIPRDQTGILVGEVATGGPADKAGLHGSYKPVTIQGERILVGGDILTAWNDTPLSNMDQLRSLLNAASPGDKVTLSVLRDGKTLKIPVTLGERP